MDFLSLLWVGVLDNSGFEFTYQDCPRSFDAGVISVGHRVTPFMVIPPNQDNFNVFGVCNSDCTQVSFCNAHTHTHTHTRTRTHTHTHTHTTLKLDLEKRPSRDDTFLPQSGRLNKNN